MSETRTINNVHVSRISFRLDESSIPILEALEILQNFNKIEDKNYNNFREYMTTVSSIYNDDTAQYVINNRKYKKSTVAFLKNVLDEFGAKNSLDKYLSPLSEYKIPEWRQ